MTARTGYYIPGLVPKGRERANLSKYEKVLLNYTILMYSSFRLLPEAGSRADTYRLWYLSEGDSVE